MNDLRIEKIPEKKLVLYFVDDIKASRDEYEFALLLVAHSIPFTFQPQPIVLIKGFKGNLKNWRDTTYTPDFKFSYNGLNYVVEIKGFMRADNSLKHKLADSIYTPMGIHYQVLKWKGSIKENTKGFYDYSWTAFKKIKDKEHLKEFEFFHKLLK